MIYGDIMSNRDKIEDLNSAFGLIVDAEDDLKNGLRKLQKAVKLIDKAGGAGVASGHLEAYVINYLKDYTMNYFEPDESVPAGNLGSVLDIIMEKMDEIEKTDD